MRILSHPTTRIYSNAIYLIASTGITAMSGFLFWIVIARAHSTGTVGIATTLLSASMLIGFIGLIGLDAGVIRYLSSSKEQSSHINSAMAMIAVATAIIALAFCTEIRHVSHKLSFVDHHSVDVVYFVIITVFTGLNTFTNCVFIAYRRTSYIIFVNIVTGLLKLALAFAIRSGGAIAIFNITGIAQIVNVILSIVFMAQAFEYRPLARVKLRVLKSSLRFSSSIYIGNIFTLLPPTILPLLVARVLGVRSSAYFYIAYTIATLLYTIPSSTTQSLYAEGSHDPASLKRNIYRSIAICGALLIPTIGLLIVVCPLILEVFGSAYRHGAVRLLQILAIGSVFVAMNQLITIIFRVTLRLRAIVLTNFVYAFSLLLAVLVLMPSFGLDGVGVAFAVGNICAVGAGIWFLRRHGLRIPQGRRHRARRKRQLSKSGVAG